MEIDLESKRDFWTEAFLAAISGFSSKTVSADTSVAEQAAVVADEALRKYVEKMLTL